MLVKLTEKEKEQYCIRLGSQMKRLRAISGLTQEGLASLSGISKERISKIENSAFVMRWVQFISFVMVFSMNAAAKEYMVASKIYTPRLIGALQMKDDHVPPDVIVPISDLLVDEFNTDFKIISSLSNENNK